MLIAHLSDSHLRTGPVGAEAATGLHRALGRVLALDPQADCVIVTGDLVDGGRTEEYSVLNDLLERFPLPVHLVRGNHDDPAAMLSTFAGSRFLADGDRLNYCVEYPDATLIVLDSDGRPGPAGHLGPQQLAWLDSGLAARPTVPAFVCMHHPPTPVGIPFLDAQRVDDGAALAEVVAARSNVVRILAGHIHRTVITGFAGTTVTVAPSTYRQSSLTMPADGRMGYVHEPPGFLLHMLDGNHCMTHLLPTIDAAAITGRF